MSPDDRRLLRTLSSGVLFSVALCIAVGVFAPWFVTFLAVTVCLLWATTVACEFMRAEIAELDSDLAEILAEQRRLLADIDRWSR